MNERPTPETDAFFRSFADGDATPSHAEYYDRMMQLERERDEARAELEQAEQDAKQHEVDCLRALGERNEARAEVQAIQHWATVNGTIQIQRELTELTSQRDAAISIGLDAVGQLIDLHHATSKRERNVEWECRADLLDRNFRKLEDLPDSKDFSCKPPNPA